MEQDPPAHAGRGWPPNEGVTAEACAAALGGAPDDWARLADAWGAHFEERMQGIAGEGKSMRLRMLGGTQVGYQRMTRRWWGPVRADLNKRRLGDAPLYFVSSNTHSLSNLVTGLARERENELVAFVERGQPRGPPGGAGALSRRAHRRRVGELPVLRGP